MTESPFAADLTPRSRRRQLSGSSIALLSLAALIVSSGVVYQASNAAFTAQTSNAGNNWSAGTVAISDDDAGSALFNATGLAGGDTGAQCIVVTYSGTVSADVRLYATAYSDAGLAPYLDLSVEEGTGANRDCSDFTSTGTLHTGTLAGFGSTRLAFGSGVSSWAPAGGPPNTSRTYRFTWTLQNNNAAQNTSATTAFTWEAQSN